MIEWYLIWLRADNFCPWKILFTHLPAFFSSSKHIHHSKATFQNNEKEKKRKIQGYRKILEDREGLFILLVLKSVRLPLLIFLFLTLTFMSCFLAIVQAREFLFEKKGQQTRPYSHPTQSYVNLGGNSPNLPEIMPSLCMYICFG